MGDSSVPQPWVRVLKWRGPRILAPACVVLADVLERCEFLTDPKERPRYVPASCPRCCRTLRVLAKHAKSPNSTR